MAQKIIESKTRKASDILKIALLFGVIIAGIGIAVWYINHPNKLSYDLVWENPSQGVTYFCNERLGNITCTVNECYDLGPQKYCRDLGFTPITFTKHD